MRADIGSQPTGNVDVDTDLSDAISGIVLSGTPFATSTLSSRPVILYEAMVLETP